MLKYLLLIPIFSFLTCHPSEGMPNQSPVVNAGKDIILDLPISTTDIKASAMDPENEILSFIWIKISGPQDLIISNSKSTEAIVSNLTMGTYILEFQAKDPHGAVGMDQVIIQVNPASAPISEYDMLVSSRNTHSVKRFDGNSGIYKGDLVAPNSGGLLFTQDLLWAHDGHLLVTGIGNDAILKYDKNTGAFLQKFTHGYNLSQPTKMALGPDSILYVSQWNKNRNNVARFNYTTGEFIDEFASGLDGPLEITWDKVGNVYIASFFTGDVRKFNKAGDFTDIFISGIPNKQGPSGIWFDAHDNFFVMDWIEGNVKKYDSKGKLLTTMISGLANAEGFAIHKNGNLYLCDYNRNRINEYNSAGDFIKVFNIAGNLNQPNAILFGPEK